MNPLSTDSCLLFQDSVGENIRQDNGYIVYIGTILIHWNHFDTLEPFWYIGTILIHCIYWNHFDTLYTLEPFWYIVYIGTILIHCIHWNHFWYIVYIGTILIHCIHWNHFDTWFTLEPFWYIGYIGTILIHWIISAKTKVSLWPVICPMSLQSQVNYLWSKRKSFFLEVDLIQTYW